MALPMDQDMSLLLRRGIRRGFVTLTRERDWGSTLGVLVGVVLLLQLLIVIGISLQGLTNLLRSQTDLRLEIRPLATDTQIQEFFVSIKAQPYIEDAMYITKEQAYEAERKRDPALVSFLEEFDLDNPFVDTIAVTLTSLSDYDAFAAFAKQPQWSDVVDPTFLSQATDQEAQVQEMLRLTRAGSTLVIVIVAIVGCMLIFVLMELVRKRALARHEEVLVERLSGAKTLSVLIPFATEAGVLLLLSCFLSVLFLLLFLFLLPILIPALAAGGVFSPLRFEVEELLVSYLPLVVTAEVILIPFASLFGVWLGMKRQMVRGLKIS